MATKTSRIELRSDPASERRIRHAAELKHQSVSAFVLGDCDVPGRDDRAR